MTDAQSTAWTSLDIWGVLRRRWGIVVFVMAICFSLAVIYLIVAPRTFSSAAHILVMRKNADLPVQSANTYGQPPQQEIGDALLATHMEIIRSSRVIGDAIDARKLENLESIEPELDPDLVAIDHRRAVIAYITEQLRVERGGESLDDAPLTFIAEFQHTNAEDAGTILTAIVASYEKFLDDTLQDVNTEAAELIGKAKDELAADIRQLEQTYQEFRLKTPMLTLGAGDLNKFQIRLGLLQTELTRLELRESELRSRLDILHETASKRQLASFSDLDRLGLIDNRDVDRLSLLLSVERGDAATNETFVAAQPARTSMEEAESEKLLTMQLSLVEEKRRLGDSHPRVKDLENSIEEMSEFLERKRKSVNDPANVAKLGSGTLVAVYSKMLEKDLEDIQRQVKEIKNGIATEEEAAVALVADELKNENMKEELDRTKSLQMAVIEWLRQRSMMEGQGGFITEVLAAPQYGEKSWPKLPIVLAASLCLGLFGGSSLALLVDLSDSSFRSTAEIEQVVGAPLIGALPTTKFLKGKNGETSISAEVVTFHQPMSVASESYRQVRTSLMFRADGKPLNLLQFTSPNPGDGKTLTAVNVANSLAQTGKRVLLVDCDLRRPRVGSLFGLSEVKGLSEVLREACELDEAIHATKAARLSVMPSGQTPSNPAELLQSHAFQNLLEVVREKFDIVVVDSPPLLAVSEATSLAQSVDGVVICLRTENTTRPEADRAIRLLQGVGVTPLGFVVNDIDRLVSQGDEEKYSGKYYGRKHMKYFEPTRTDRADSNKA